LWPLVWLGQKITKSLKKDKSKSVLSRADFSAMTALGEKEGVFKAGESKIIHNLLRFNEIRTKDIMTPRTVVIAAKDDMTIQDFYNKNKTLRFSRIPIYDDTKDHINGFILKDILLINLVNNNGNKLLKEIKREILIVHERLNIPDLFNKLMESREHIALVVGEFGGMSGIVTMEDVIETLLGMEIVDEFDNTADMQQLARRNWEKRAEGLGILKNNENENIDPKQ
jgi:CBS domain containing-hemolysin-like protein